MYYYTEDYLIRTTRFPIQRFFRVLEVDEEKVVIAFLVDPVKYFETGECDVYSETFKRQGCPWYVEDALVHLKHSRC